MTVQKRVTQSLQLNGVSPWLSQRFRPVVLPILLTVIPSLYHYSNNLEKLTPGNLFRMIDLNTVIAVLIYLVCLIFFWFRPIKAAIATFVFLIFFNTYGLMFRYLLNLDLFRVEHFSIFPLTILVSIYVILFVTRLEQSVLVTIWKNLSLMTAFLVLFNLIKIAPMELKRWKSNPATVSAAVTQLTMTKTSFPDIYFIIMDEFVGFQGMRDYWEYPGVDDFVQFLKDRSFFVAEDSHGSSRNTELEVASRLNYHQYSPDEHLQVYLDAIEENKVVHYLKIHGYTIVTFDERKLALYTAKPIRADYTYTYGYEYSSSGGMKVRGFFLDEFGDLVMGNTMYYMFAEKYKNSTPTVRLHNNMINLTVDHVASMDVPSPKFVYAHLLLPHPPFMFDRNGGTELGHFTDWNYYLDNYIYAMKVARKMVENIMANANPNNPPIIILQSDHGGRNESTVESVFLSNYPEELKTLILFALYMPGYDSSNLPQDINPVNTFPIVFNYVFHDHLPLVK